MREGSGNGGKTRKGSGVLLVLLLALPAGAALSQQYRNLEVTPDGRGGGHGSYGGRNFEYRRDYGQPPTGHIGGRSLGTLHERPARTPGNTGATQRRCYVDGNGQAICY